MSLQISVVIPCYNAADWLPETVRHIRQALAHARVMSAEIIIVDDGSTDGSAKVAKSIRASYPIEVIEQSNSGRFLARKAGVERAKYPYILFMDTRVHIDEGSLAFIAQQIEKHPDRQIWNGHVNVAKEGNIIARFGDAITFIGWRRYFAHPKTTSYGLEDFDHYPKGTGCFFVPRKELVKALHEFELATTDLRYSSDDTLLIRILARDHRINLSPEFSCIYYARTSLRQFIRHSYNRGQFFVDGFLRKGTRFFYPLIGVFIASAAFVAGLVIWPGLVGYAVAAFLVGWLLELVVARLLSVPAKDALSLFLLTPIFVMVYTAGLWRGLIRKVI